MKQRSRPEVRRDQILAAALTLAAANGYKHITREGVAVRAECSPGLVTHYFSTMAQLKRAVMRAAVTQCVVAVVAQGLADRDPHARKAPAALKAQALSSLSA